MRIPTHYLNNILDFAEAEGASRSWILEYAGVTQETLDDPDAWLEYEQFHRLISGVLQASGDPALGIRLGSQLRVTAHGLLGYAAMSSASFDEALDLVVRFAQTRVPVLSMNRSEVDGAEILGIEEAAVLGEIREPLLELTVAALHAIARFLIDDRFECRELRFAYEEPEHVDRYREFFDCPLVFSADVTEMRFDSRLLRVPLPLADEGAKRQAAQRCEEELAAMLDGADLEQRIRAKLLKVEAGVPGLDETAAMLGMSARTLRRRLREAGTSYQKILDSVRSDLATQYLRTTRLTVYQIADRLGYSDQANFGRAFKRWTGRSPQELRDEG